MREMRDRRNNPNEPKQRRKWGLFRLSRIVPINNFLYGKGYGVYTLEHVAFPGCDQFRGTHETHGPKPEIAT
jgi:hypothetical protein